MNDPSYGVAAARFLAAFLFLFIPHSLAFGDKAGAAAKSGKPPNIVFFLADDLGWRDAGCYGSTFYETPNIDRLAKQGMRFTSAYAACPVCSPTRASIMTGKYPARLGTTDYFGAPQPEVLQARPKYNKPLLPAHYLAHLPLQETSVAKALREGGYATFFTGKWHLGGAGFLPEDHGFDINIGGFQAGSPASYFSPYKNPKLPDGPVGEHLDDRMAAESVKFLEHVGGKPFLLYHAFYSVHIPLQAKKELIAKYEAKRTRLAGKGPLFEADGQAHVRQIQEHAVYAAMIESMDHGMGQVLDALDRLGLAGNTIVFFMSDNGGLSTAEGSPTSNLPLRAGKGWLYEGGIREPMIVRWPGVVKPGSSSGAPVISTDFYPTILEMAGLPPRPKQHLDGVSLVPVLQETGKLAERPLYWHYPHYSNQGGRPGSVVRLGDWKLIEFFEDHRVELYNLQEDLGEKHDLAAERAGKAAELRKRLQAWREAVGARLPTPNPKYKADVRQDESAFRFFADD
jgi:arylsulfatase A-like enzyme